MGLAGPGPARARKGLVVGPQLQLPGGYGITIGLSQGHQLLQALHLSALLLQLHITGGGLQKTLQCQAFHNSCPTIATAKQYYAQASAIIRLCTHCIAMAMRTG
jgi:hypothetical protein